MKRLVRTLGAGPGKKSVLYISNGFAIPTGIINVDAPAGINTPPPPAWDHMKAVAIIEELVREANAADVRFYATNPSVADDSAAFAARVEDMAGLRDLTLPTGGVYGFGLEGVDKISSAVSDDASSYYSIAYQSTGAGNDRTKRVRVLAKNRSYRVRARETFVDKSRETEARERLLASFFGGSLPDDLTLTVSAAGPPKAARGKNVVPVTVEVPSDQLAFQDDEVGRVAQLRILIQTANGSEARPLVERDLRIVSGRDDPKGLVRYVFDLPLGGGDVTIGVLDRSNGHLGAMTILNARQVHR
jgi:hypothetical protein